MGDTSLASRHVRDARLGLELLHEANVQASTWGVDSLLPVPPTATLPLPGSHPREGLCNWDEGWTQPRDAEGGGSCPGPGALC